MRQILVTGGAGFIGSNFVHYVLCSEPDVQIINLDALTYAGSLENLKDLPDPSRHVFIHGNITDRELVDHIFSEYKIDTVVHFAAETHVDRSILDPVPLCKRTLSAPTPYWKLRAKLGWWIKPFRLKRYVFITSPLMRSLARSAKRIRLLGRKPLTNRVRLMRLPRLRVIILCALTPRLMACPSVSATALITMDRANSPKSSSH